MFCPVFGQGLPRQVPLLPYDQRSRKAVDRLVHKTRKEVMSARVGGLDLDGAEGSMNELPESLSLIKFLERHNYLADPFQMDEHQPVCVGHQFKDGITFMCLTTRSTPHLLNNMARAENCGCQKTAHVDGSFNWCKKNFKMIGICMTRNSMGAHYNPVSVTDCQHRKFRVEGSNQICIRRYVHWPVYIVQLSQFEPCVRFLQPSVRADQRARLTVKAAAWI
jgi:hypothetical protein